jgi:hypothetical protein
MRILNGKNWDPGWKTVGSAMLGKNIPDLDGDGKTTRRDSSAAPAVPAGLGMTRPLARAGKCFQNKTRQTIGPEKLNPRRRRKLLAENDARGNRISHMKSGEI